MHTFVTVNGFSNLCLDARDGAKADWSVVQQWTCKDKNARSMVWYTEPGDFPRALKVRNFNSDLCLDVREGSSDEFAQAQLWRSPISILHGTISKARWRACS